MEKRTVKGIVYAAAATFAVFFAFKYIISLFLPFIIAFLIAAILNCPIRILTARLRLSRKVVTAILVVALSGMLGFILFLLFSRLGSEIKELFAALSEQSDEYINLFFGFLEKLSNRLPLSNAFGADLSEAVKEAVKGMLSTFTAKIPSVIANMIATLPHILLFSVILILASYYFSANFDLVGKKMLSLLPQGAKEALSRFGERLARSGLKYLKCCFFMLIITYFELLVGFLMLNIPYAFSLSLLVAAVDMLPILGVGTVLVPWAFWCRLTGDTFTAVGLLIIFAAVTVIRRFIEPRVIGAGIGLSPITTLIAMYLGFRLYGLTGLFLSPLVAILILHALPLETAERLGFTGGE